MNFARIWCIPNPTPAGRVTPPWNVYMAKFDPGWEGYPVWQTGLPALAGHPTYHVNVIKLKWEIIWTGGLPHLSGLPHLPGVPHLHVNRPLDASFRKIVISFMLSVLRLGSFVSRTKYWNASCFSLVTQRSKGGEIVTKRSLVAKMKNNWYFLW